MAPDEPGAAQCLRDPAVAFAARQRQARQEGSSAIPPVAQRLHESEFGERLAADRQVVEDANVHQREHLPHPSRERSSA